MRLYKVPVRLENVYFKNIMYILKLHMLNIVEQIVNMNNLQHFHIRTL